MGEDRISKYKLIILAVVAVLFIGIAVIVVKNLVKNNNESNIETVGNQDITINMSEDETEVESEEDNESEQSAVGVYNKLMNDVISIKSGDASVIKKYYGNSDEFVNRSSEIFSTLKVEKLDENDEAFRIKVDTLDYELIDIDRKEFTRQVLEANSGISDENLKSYVDVNINENKDNGKYYCYFILTISKDENVNYITENLKRALSGKYYNSLFCSIESYNE